MLPRSFEYARPATLPDALDLLRRQPGARALAGGQSLLNVLKLRTAQVDALIDVSRLEELRFVSSRPDGGLEIGAGMTYAELAGHPQVQERHPIVAEIAAHLVDVQVRNRGTIGGNACYNDPTSNFPPLLVALDARMQVAGAAPREVDARAFFLGHYRVALDTGELLRSIVLPPLGEGAGIGYQSLQIARDSWALARAAAWVSLNGAVTDARVVVGCLGPAPARQPAMEAALRGSAGDDAAIAAAVAAPLEGVEPVGDVHASAEYRVEMGRVQVARAIRQALASTRGAS